MVKTRFANRSHRSCQFAVAKFHVCQQQLDIEYLSVQSITDSVNGRVPRGDMINQTMERGAKNGWLCSNCSWSRRSESQRLMDIKTLVAHGERHHHLSGESLNEFVNQAHWEERNPETSNLGRGYGPATQYPNMAAQLQYDMIGPRVHMPTPRSPALVRKPYVTLTFADSGCPLESALVGAKLNSYAPPFQPSGTAVRCWEENNSEIPISVMTDSADYNQEQSDFGMAGHINSYQALARPKAPTPNSMISGGSSGTQKGLDHEKTTAGSSSLGTQGRRNLLSSTVASRVRFFNSASYAWGSPLSDNYVPQRTSSLSHCYSAESTNAPSPTSYTKGSPITRSQEPLMIADINGNNGNNAVFFKAGSPQHDVLTLTGEGVHSQILESKTSQPEPSTALSHSTANRDATVAYNQNEEIATNAPARPKHASYRAIQPENNGSSLVEGKIEKYDEPEMSFSEQLDEAMGNQAFDACEMDILDEQNTNATFASPPKSNNTCKALPSKFVDMASGVTPSILLGYPLQDTNYTLTGSETPAYTGAVSLESQLETASSDVPRIFAISRKPLPQSYYDYLAREGLQPYGSNTLTTVNAQEFNEVDYVNDHRNHEGLTDTSQQRELDSPTLLITPKGEPSVHDASPFMGAEEATSDGLLFSPTFSGHYPTLWDRDNHTGIANNTSPQDVDQQGSKGVLEIEDQSQKSALTDVSPDRGEDENDDRMEVVMEDVDELDELLDGYGDNHTYDY